MANDSSPEGTSTPTEHRAREVLELGLAIGEILLAEGMGARDVVASVVGVARAYGLRRVHVDVTYTHLAATYSPVDGSDPITAFRVVYPEDLNYLRVRRLDQLLRDIRSGIPFEAAAATFGYIRDTRPVWPVWVSTVGNALIGVGVILLFTTSWRDVLMAFVSCVIIDVLLRVTSAVSVPVLFQQVLGAMVATLFAATVEDLGALGYFPFDGANPALVVVGGIVMLIAGMQAVGAATDAIDEFYVTASARTFEALLRTGGIVGGVIIGIRIADLVGTPIHVDAVTMPLGAFGPQVFGAALISAGFAIWAYADRTTIALAAVMGILGWLGYTVAVHAGGGETSANAFGALVAAFAATLTVRHSSVPAFALIDAALLPLVPGLALYSGLLTTFGTSPGDADPAGGTSALLAAFLVAVGIGAGASAGTYLGRPVADGVQRRRRRRRPKAGPGL